MGKEYNRSAYNYDTPKSPMDRINEYLQIKKLQEKNATQVNEAGGGYMANNSIFGNGFA